MSLLQGEHFHTCSGCGKESYHLHINCTIPLEVIRCIYCADPAHPWLYDIRDLARTLENVYLIPHLDRATILNGDEGCHVCAKMLKTCQKYIESRI